jgi:hypothetical protein
MKCAFLIALLFALTGCHHRRPAPPSSSRFSLPTNCLVGFEASRSQCRAVSMDQAICDGVVVKFACLKVQQ